jgi:hemerythrin-like domain-containing protein
MIMRLPPNHVAIRVIQEDHDRLSALIHGMQYFARAIGKGGNAPDPKVFRAMLLYISDYPEKVHHPKEDLFLFARLRSRAADVDAAINELEAQHASGETLVHELEHALARYEFEGEAAAKPFLYLVERYAKFYFDHMRLEEEVILPAANQYLTAEDWEILDHEFSLEKDPLTGREYKAGFDKLFSVIVNIAPAPIGLGPAIPE